MNHGYSRGTAAVYDAAIGRQWFERARRRFERVIRAHRVSFRDAADVGCGTGLFARYLHDCHGVPVLAVDSSAGMLAEAKLRCAGRPAVTLLRQDIRRLALPRQVDLVTAHFDMLNHLPTLGALRAACASIAANLRPGGWFYFDLLTPCFPLGPFDAIIRRVRWPGASYEQRAVWVPGRRMIGVRAQVAFRSQCGTARVADWHTERAFGAEEIGRALAEAGFIVRTVRDEETLRPAGACPSRLVVLAQKPGPPVHGGSH